MGNESKKIKSKNKRVAILCASIITAIAVVVTCVLCMTPGGGSALFNGVGGDVNRSAATYTDPASGANYTHTGTRIYAGDTIVFNYTGNYKYVTLPHGTYTFTAYGAQGNAGSNGGAGGNGGMAKGNYEVTGTSATVYIYVGGQSGWGGYSGGSGGTGTYSNNGGNGGGSTDVRVGGTAVSYRVLVGGGGGGGGGGGNAGSPGQGKWSGGGAGGASGTAGSNGTADSSTAGNGGNPGTTSAAGTGGSGNLTTTSTSTDGAYYPAGGGGGGAGYYGGGGGGGGGIRGQGSNAAGAAGNAGSAGTGGKGGNGAASSTAGYYSGSGGGGGGGSNYVGGCISGTTSTTASSRTGNGYCTITVVKVNDAPTALSVSGITVSSLDTNVNRTITSSQFATDPDGTYYGKTASTVYFCKSTTDLSMATGTGVAGLYLNSACTVSASAYVNYNFSSTTSLTITSFKKLPRNGIDGLTSDTSMTLYVVIRDDYNASSVSTNFYVVCSVAVTFSKYTSSINSGTGTTTDSTRQYQYKYGPATTNSFAAIEGGGIYSQSYTTSSTPYAVSFPKAISKGTSATLSATTFTSNPSTSKFRLLIAPDAMPSGKPYTITGAGAQTFYYWTGSTYASKTGYTSLTINGVTPSPDWQRETWRIYLVEIEGMRELNTNHCTYGGTWLTSSGGRQFEVTFRVDNNRPDFKSGVNNVIDIGVGATRTISLNEMFSDEDDASITTSTHTISNVILPEYEFVQADQFGRIKSTLGKGGAASTASYYNVVTNNTLSTATYTTTGTGSLRTNFKSGIVSAGSANPEAFMQYSYSGISITVVGLRSSYSQYDTTRSGAAYTGGTITDTGITSQTTGGAMANPGHFYLLVQITDLSDRTDTGIWLPIAFTVGASTTANTLPVNTGTIPSSVSGQNSVTTLPTADGQIGDVFYFTPMGMSIGSTLSPIGWRKDGNSLKNDDLIPLALDADHFTTSTGISSWNGSLNEFLSITSSEIAKIESSINTTDGGKYIKVTEIPIYIPTSYFNGRVQQGSGSTAGVKYTTFDGTENFDNVSYYKTKGFSIELLSGTMNRYLQPSALIMDSTTQSITVYIAVRATNTAPELVDDSKVVVDPTYSTYVIEDDGTPTITYNVPMNNGIMITPYDIVRDANMAHMHDNGVDIASGFTLNGLTGTVTATNNIAKFTSGAATGGSGSVTSVYGNAYAGNYETTLAQMLEKIDAGSSVISRLSTGNLFATAASTGQTMYYDRLFFARNTDGSAGTTDPFTYNPVGNADFSLVSRNTNGYVYYELGNQVTLSSGTPYNLDFLYIYAHTRNPESAPISFDLTVRDRYGNSDGDNIAFRVIVNIVNVSPTALTNPAEKIAVNLVNIPTSYNIGVDSVATDKDDPSLYFEMSKGMLVANSLSEVLAIEGIRSVTSLTDLIDPEAALFTGPDGSLLSDSYVSFEMISTDTVVATAINSTQHIPGGVYVFFFVTDLRTSTLCYQQIEVLNSPPVLNTSDTDGFTYNTDYTWSIESTSNADIVRERFIVGTRTASNALITQYRAQQQEAGATNIRSAIAAADIKLIATDPDSLQNNIILSQTGGGKAYYNLNESEAIDTRYENAVPNVVADATGITQGGTPKAIAAALISSQNLLGDAYVPEGFADDVALTLLFYVDGTWYDRNDLITELKGGDDELKTACFDDNGRWIVKDWALSIQAREALSNLKLVFSLRDEAEFGGDDAGEGTGYDADRPGRSTISGKVAGNRLSVHATGNSFELPTVFMSISRTGIRTKDEYGAYDNYYVVSDPREGKDDYAYVSTYEQSGSTTTRGENSGKAYSELLTWISTAREEYLADAYQYPEVITVPATRTGDSYDTVYVPMSFFGLQSDIATIQNGQVSYYDNAFVGYDLRERDEAVPYNKGDINDIKYAIRLSDGTNVWGGENGNLNSNPYVTIGATDYGTYSSGNKSTWEANKPFNEPLSKKYYNKALVVPNINSEGGYIGYDQSAYADSFLHISNGEDDQIQNAFLYLEDQSYYLIEHNFGLTFKKNNIRTGVRNLTLTIDLAISKITGEDSAEVDLSAVSSAPSSQSLFRSVSVYIKVENSMIDIVPDLGNDAVVKADPNGDNVYYVDIKDNFYAGQTLSYGLVRKNVTDSYESIGSAKPIYYTDTDYAVVGDTTYRDTAYFRNDSVNMLSTWGVDPNRPMTVEGNKFTNTTNSSTAQNSMLNFYNATDYTDFSVDSRYQPNGGVYGSNASASNNANLKKEGFSSYFSLSFTQSSRVINIMASKKTTINSSALEGIVREEFPEYSWSSLAGEYGGLSKAQLTEIYASRGLVVEFKNTETIDIDRVYYPLTVLLYDDCGAGWGEASYVAIQFRITISNATPKLKDVGDKNGEAWADDGRGHRLYTISLGVESSVLINLYDIVSDNDIYVPYGDKTLLTKKAFDSSKGIIRETSDYLESMFAYTPISAMEAANQNAHGFLSHVMDDSSDVTMWMQLGSEGTTLSHSLEPDDNQLGFTVHRRSTGEDGSAISSFDFTVTFRDNHGEETEPITFRVVVTNKNPTIKTKVRNITMRAGDSITLLTAYYNDFVGGVLDTTTPRDYNKDGIAAYKYSMTNGAYYRAAGNKTYYDERLEEAPWDLHLLTEQYCTTGANALITDTVSDPEYENRRNVNMGYIGVATDDTTWKLRFLPNYTTEDYWEVTEYDETMIEGLQSEIDAYYAEFGTRRAPLALTIKAVSACENKQFRFTLIDGDGGVVTYEQLYITIVSSTPEPIDPATNDQKLANAHIMGVRNPNGTGYLSGTYMLFGIPYGTAYVSVNGIEGREEDGGKVYASSHFEISMTDVASDPDPGEDDNMRLYNNGSIRINNSYVNMTQSGERYGCYEGEYFYVSILENERKIAIDITGYNPNSSYETLEFSIADPGNSQNYLVITLRIYTLYSDLQNPTVASMSEADFADYLNGEFDNEVYVKAYDAFYGRGEYASSSTNTPYTSSRFAVVSLDGNDGTDGNDFSPVVDPDVNSTGKVSYGISVYAFLNSDGTPVDTTGFFNRDNKTGQFELTEEAREYAESHYLLGGYSTRGTSVTSTTPENLSRVSQYVIMSFSADGAAILFEPQTATIDKDIILYVEIEKKLGTRTETRTDAIMHAGAIFKLVVDDSAPRSVQGAAGGTSYQQSISGYKGQSFTFKIYDPQDPDSSLFVDSDIDDKVTINGFDPLDTTDSSYEAALADALDADPTLDWARSPTKTERAITVTVNRSADRSAYDTVTITINRRMDKIENGQYLDSVTFPIRFTGVDLSGKTCDTVVRLTVRNTVTTASTETIQRYNESNLGYRFSKAEGDMYRLEVHVVQGHDVTINFTDFIFDGDYSNSSDNDSFMLVEGAAKSPYSYVINDPVIAYYYESMVYDIKTELATIEPLGPDSRHRTGILISAITTTRSLTGLAYLRIIDRAGDADRNSSEGITIEISITVMNEAPQIKEGMNAMTYTILGSTTSPEVISLNIADFVTDINESDVVGDDSSKFPDTYLRIFSTTYLPYENLYSTLSTTSGSFKIDTDVTDSSALFTVVIPENTYNQQFEIHPIAGFYGSGSVNITIADGDVNVKTDTQLVTIRVNVSIIYNPNEIGTLNSITTARGKTKVISIDTLIPDIHNTLSDLETSSGSRTVAPKNASASFNPANAYVLQNVTIPRESEDYFEISRQEGSSTWLLRGIKTTVEPHPVNVTYALKSNPEQSINSSFMVSVDENEKPRLINKSVTFVRYSEDATDTMFMLDSQNAIRLRAEMIFFDREEDVMRFISASSEKPSLISVEITSNNQLRIVFKARGEAEITIGITDETDEVVTRTLKVINNDLPEPSLWMSVAASFESNTVVWSIIIGAVVLILFILILLIAISKKKKREREELEALLVSEMEIEEQMLRLSGGPSPTGYESFGYLQSAPAGNAVDPSMMLAAGEETPAGPELALPAPDQEAPQDQTPPNNGEAAGSDGSDIFNM